MDILEIITWTRALLECMKQVGKEVEIVKVKSHHLYEDEAKQYLSYGNMVANYLENLTVSGSVEAPIPIAEDEHPALVCTR